MYEEYDDFQRFLWFWRLDHAPGNRHWTLSDNNDKMFDRNLADMMSSTKCTTAGHTFMSFGHSFCFSYFFTFLSSGNVCNLFPNFFCLNYCCQQ